jgi:transposase-like protein
MAKRYPSEFRRDVAALVLDRHRSVADVAKELDVVEQTVSSGCARSVLTA